MIWNLFLHIAMGYFGKNIFNFSTEGFVWLIGITLFIQGIDMFRFYKTQTDRVYRTMDISAKEEMLEHMKTNAHKFKILQIYLLKVLFYSGITLFVAYLFR